MLAHPDFRIGSLLSDIQKGSSHKKSVGEVAMIIYVYMSTLVAMYRSQGKFGIKTCRTPHRCFEDNLKRGKHPELEKVSLTEGYVKRDYIGMYRV